MSRSSSNLRLIHATALVPLCLLLALCPAARLAGAQTAAAKRDQSGQAAGEGEGVQEEHAQPLDPDQLNQRLGKWAYRIPEHLYKRLSTARAELVQ